VKLGSSVVFDPSSWTNPSYPDLQSRAYQSGARISSNSWGSATSGAYTIDSQAYDALVRDAQPASSAFPTSGNQEMVIVFSAGNLGPGARSVGAPATAKNVLTIGASDSVQPFGGADGCGIDDSAASGFANMAPFSSRGPCTDGRHKPDLVAPGTHVTGGVFQQSGGPGTGLGLASFLYDGSGVCGGPITGPNADLFWPPGQQWTTASSGTSHACPAVVGGAAPLRQLFLNRGLAPPSPAMTKAYIMSSARYLGGTGAGDSLWSDVQGMGGMDLARTFDLARRVVRDQLPEDLFTATGQSRSFTGNVADPTRPLRVTLAWTDAPGSTVGAAYKNDLDLTVTVGGNTYLGNVFSGPASVTGGSPDRKNNVESVFLPPGITGAYTVTITAANINSDGIPNVGGALDQDFALSIYNSNLASAPRPVPDGASVPGAAMTAARLSADGSSVRVTWDAGGCPASAYSVYSGPLSAVFSSTYDNWSNCGLAPTGTADVTLGTGSVFFVVVPVEGTVEGSHGLDSQGRERPGSGAGHCGVLRKDLSGTCP
jgi:hypothetical protein